MRNISFLQNIQERFRKFWESLTPDKKRKFILLLAGLLVVIGVTGLIYDKSKRNENTSKIASSNDVNQTVKKIDEVDPDFIKKTQYVESMKAIEELKKANEELSKKLEELEKVKETKEKETEKKEKNFSSFSSPPPPPPPLPPPPPSSLPPLSSQGSMGEVKKEEVVLSGIELAEYKVEKKGQAVMKDSNSNVMEKADKEVESKEVKKKYYLPPSFMEATLLSGLDAPAVSKGEGHPVPVLLRVKAPAVLPNKVKANLRGCFIIAEGLGNLASERADLRLVSLSCIDKKGRAVIDQKIKGFVVDTDGKIGLRGRVVSKMGGALARAFLAGFVSGFGNVIASQSQSTTTTPSGALSTIEPGKALQFGVGSGIQQMSNELLKFYLELARQSIPVVEILPTRSVTVILSEGVGLVLKDLDI